MNRFPVSFGFIAAAFFTCVLAAICVLNVRDRVAWVDAYDGVFWIETEHGLTAETVAPEGPAYLSGVRVGDHLLAIDGLEMPDLGVYAENLLAAGPGARLDYTVLTAAGIRNLPVPLAARNLFTAWDGVKTLLAFFYLGIGVFVVLRAPEGAEKADARRFYFLCLAAFVLWATSYTPALGALDICVYALSAAAFLILPAILVHFCLRFAGAPADSLFSPAWTYIFSGFLCFTHLLWATGNLAPFGITRTVGGSAIIDRIEITYFGAAFIAGGWILLKRHLRANDIIVRQQMKWIGCGVLAGTVPFGLIYIIPTLLGVKANLAIETSALFLALIPLAAGYAVLRYRLMDVEDIARRSVACLLTAAALLLLPVAASFIFSKDLRELTPFAGTLVAATTLLALALLFAPLRRVVQGRLDRTFYRNYYKDRLTLLDFARTLGAEISLRPLARDISERIVKAFPVNRAVILMADPARPGFFRFIDGVSRAADLRISPVLPNLKNLSLRADDLPEYGAPCGLAGLKNGPEYLRLAGDALSREGFTYRQDLHSHGRRVGTLAMGELPRGRHFSGEDVELLSAMAGYAAIALEKTVLQEQLTQAEKLSSIGLLAAGVAHEINTPLTGISSYTQILLKENAVDDERSRVLLKKIEKQTFRAAEIVGGLLSFSRLGGSEFAAVDINQIIHDSLALLDHQLDRNRIRVARKLYEALPPVYGNTGKLQQVFVNLFLNARDAMPSGGELGIHTDMNESTVVVDISDTGDGIPGENLKRIFDPFFTTKGIGKGTGLGLAVSYGIIQEHGGGIFVESDAGKGTRFTLKLPARLN